MHWNGFTEEYYAPWEQAFKRIVTPFEEFIHEETASGILLLACTCVALLLANSALADTYEHVLHTPIALSIGSWRLEHSLHHWINDGLMALFFFVVGLEIKREVLVGELSTLRQAILPGIAAVGGMLVPASLYFLLNMEGPGTVGWAIPMATDIAFAVGVMALLGDRVPKSLFTFLVALAIVDDLGGVAVIALFYTEQLHWSALGVAGLLLVILVAFNLSGIRKPWPYFFVGTLLWLAMLKSGVHATIAGVLTAWTIPARPKFDYSGFSSQVRRLMDNLDRHAASHIIHSEAQKAILQALKNGIHAVETPLQRLEHSMHIPVAFLIIPLFALANAGILIDPAELNTASQHPVTLGVILGLVGGKFVGIAGVTLLAAKLGLGRLPTGVQAMHIVGVGFLGGIGFTMAIFIAELGFGGDAQLLLMAKMGIPFASLGAGILGYICLLIARGRVAGSPG